MQPTDSPHGSQLTKREREVIELVSLGLTNGEIARQLSLSRRTVEAHVEHVRAKLGAPTRMRAVVEAGRARLLRVVPSDAQERRYNLPVQVTSFIGRETELAEVKALLGNSRFTTIVGTGGVGKTRLAVQVGAELLDAYRDGVWLADLAKISAGDSVASEIAFALGIKPQAYSEISDHVLAHLKNRNPLLIIDNCEHVTPQAAQLIDHILKVCARVTVLATAREPLRHAGEQLYRLGSLDVPDRDDLSAAEALGCSAIALFVARAQSADAHFTFSGDDVGAVIQICRRLGGVPLALELAAARVMSLSLSQLIEHLHEQFRLLVSHDNTVHARHQTMRATLDWSYNLLTDKERRFLQRLAIFQGGWTDEAAFVVTDLFADQFAALDAVSSLVDKSLVAVDLRARTPRYRLLEPIRQYASELLKRDGEYDGVALRHAEYFLGFTGRANDQWLVVEELERLASIEEEMDNIRAALEWALLLRESPLLGARLAANLWTFWQARHQHEGRRWLETAQSSVSSEAEPELSILLALARCRLFLFTDVEEMLSACEQAIRPARVFGHPALLQRAVMYYAAALTVAHRPVEAQGPLAEALDLAKRAGDHYRAAYTLAVQCKVERQLGRYDDARLSLTQMIEEHGRVHAPFDPSEALMILLRAGMEQLEGRLANAIELCREAHRIARAVHDPSQDIHARYGLAAYLLLSGTADEALVHALSILKTSRDELFPYGVGPAFQILAGVTTQRGEYEQAARFLGYANARFSQQRIPPDAWVNVEPKWFRDPLCDHLGEGRLCELMAEGAGWSEDRAIGEVAPFSSQN